MAEIEFLGQPFADTRRLGHLLEDALASANSFWVMTAWAQISGLGLIEDSVRALRARGGSAEAVVGIDGGIATREALELAVDLFDPISVFHDPSSRTFHPKLYVVTGLKGVLVLSGSSNLTEGGLFRNYEANIALRLSPGRKADAVLLTEVEEFKASVLGSGMPSRALDLELIDELAKESTLLPLERKRTTAERSRRAKAATQAAKFFSPPTTVLPTTPKSAKPARKGGPAGKRQSPKGTAPIGAAQSTAAALPGMVWWKKATKSDVIAKTVGNQRKMLVLNRAKRRDIDWTTWFRFTFFDDAIWTSELMRGGKSIKEVAIVPFEVTIGGKFIGTYDLQIEHAPNRVANQGNSPTYINWSTMTGVIKAKSYVGWWILLERLVDGTYRMTLSSTEPSVTL